MKDGFNNLRKLSDNLKKLDGQQQQVSLGTLFNEGFIQSHTDFESIDELFEKAGFKVESEEDFAAIPQEEIDTFVRENTKFESFTDMQQQAATEYFGKQLFKGIK
ncbi:hypothetical protein NNO95_02410 [Acinetobacter baumannii]|uniref:Uncharacterized protein n=1 Tax=Acinetobacter nosocomialis TaxID=106654 RepID=A0AB37CUU5_ACINO|nr:MULTISPECIES: hypothetical protein [Acinetobacter calcoaceticus/baumannii complex]MCQ1053241.1 hypothetical protein [Acinetobacter baumannii]QGA43575.1 hypothetical protein GD578_06745 [Acinetobacter nosocomialis]